ncbi:hypothetical protein PpBr36_06974 [Pyricularia pennisetigena]|nr:hypothetical protein PpBr36_06974 [Pyricularia pennisetigena]TLS25650.1 hypothetical protein PpBr36_06974 [Pyricularia pennisetigena]
MCIVLFLCLSFSQTRAAVCHRSVRTSAVMPYGR